MKKLTFIAAIAVIALSSCKKEYKCCWYTDGELDEDYGVCATTKMTKKQADEAETTVTVGSTSYDWKCEKQ